MRERNRERGVRGWTYTAPVMDRVREVDRVDAIVAGDGRRAVEVDHS